MTNSINITTHFARQVIAAASNGCNGIVPGTIRESSQLCGPTFWNSLVKPDHLLAGRIIAKAVDRGLLPLIKLRESGSNHQRYERQ